MQVTHIQRDHTLKAVELQSTADYPIRFYLDVMDDFEQTCIHWHWHPELEFNVITRGTIEYYVENEHYTLSAGQGILKNANVPFVGKLGDRRRCSWRNMASSGESAFGRKNRAVPGKRRGSGGRSFWRKYSNAGN